MKNIFALILFVLSSWLHAQQGDFLLTHHSPVNTNLDNSNFEIISDNDGLICLANRTGVLKYDGESWDYYPTPSAALSLDVDESNVIYTGSINDVGKIDLKGNRISFQSLINTDSINDLFLQTFYHNGSIYFLGSHHLISYEVETEQTWITKGDFINLYELEDELYLNTADSTFKIVEDSLVPSDPGIQISSSHTFGRKPPLLVDFEGKMFVWEDRPKTIIQNKLIEENGYEINEAKWVNDSLIACSTFSDGVVFLNYNDADYIEVADYHSGLPDNEIYSLHTDSNGGVWIAHPFGLTSVSPLFPAFSYSNFPGLKGNLTGLFQVDNKLWVTTSLGLFQFDKDTTFKNQVYYTKVQKKRNRPVKTQTKSKETTEAKKPILKGLFRKKRRAEDTSKKEKKGFLKTITKGVSDLFDNSDNVDRISGKLDKNVKYERRVRKVPVKINYKFSQVAGTDGKFMDLLKYGDKLLLIGNSGIYEITSEGSELVISENVRKVLPVSSGQLLVSTSDFQLKVFNLTDNIWVEQTSSSVDDIIVNMTEDSNGKVWLAGSSGVYNINLTDSSMVFSNSYTLNNRFLDDMDIIERQDTIYFINSQGYFYYDSQNDTIAENISLKSRPGVPVSSISEPSGDGVWVNNGKNWYLIPSDGEIRQFEYMGLFRDLHQISKDEDSNDYWLLTRGNQLLKYNPEKSSELAAHKLFVKKITNPGGDIDKRQKFTLSYDENFLSIELSKPDFLGLLNPEFQYKLNGLHTEWSEWTRSKFIDFSYLPAGQYSLVVRSRDAFGRVEEAEMFEFVVRSPYWQRPWFYALQIIFFGALVVVSSRLNQSKTQNRLLSGALSVLTLVLIIEFIQSAAGALLNIQSTPVVDFLIDVFVALLIFPLEKFLREFLSNGKVDVNIKELPVKKIPVKRKKKTVASKS